MVHHCHWCLTWLGLLPSLFLTIDIVADTITNCSEPDVPNLQLISKDNFNKAYPILGSYTNKTVSLPLQCVYAAEFVLYEPANMTCLENGTWITDSYECVSRIYLMQPKTKTIIIISGAVFGALAALFVIVKVIFHRRRRNKSKKLHYVNDIEMRMRMNQYR